jgi:hypothetical protein
MLASLPLIESVTVTTMPALTTLSFASTVYVPHLADNLDSLTLIDCTELPLTEVHHLHSMHDQRQLDLKGSFTSRRDELILACFTPAEPDGTQRPWPKLIRFGLIGYQM